MQAAEAVPAAADIPLIVLWQAGISVTTLRTATYSGLVYFSLFSPLAYKEVWPTLLLPYL
jgi:hypothetical protein